MHLIKALLVFITRTVISSFTPKSPTKTSQVFQSFYTLLFFFLTPMFQFFPKVNNVNNPILHACTRAWVYWCVAVTVVFQASLPLPVNSVKNSQEHKGRVAESGKWRSYNAGDGG